MTGRRDVLKNLLADYLEGPVSPMNALTQTGMAVVDERVGVYVLCRNFVYAAAGETLQYSVAYFRRCASPSVRCVSEHV